MRLSFDSELNSLKLSRSFNIIYSFCYTVIILFLFCVFDVNKYY